MDHVLRGTGTPRSLIGAGKRPQTNTASNIYAVPTGLTSKNLTSPASPLPYRCQHSWNHANKHRFAPGHSRPHQCPISEGKINRLLIFPSNLRRFCVISVYNQFVAAAEQLPRNGDLEGEGLSFTAPRSRSGPVATPGERRGGGESCDGAAGL